MTDATRITAGVASSLRPDKIGAPRRHYNLVINRVVPAEKKRKLWAADKNPAALETDEQRKY